MWQEVIVGICVVAALAFTLRRFWLKQSGSCGSSGSCGGCGSNQACKSPEKSR